MINRILDAYGISFERSHVETITSGLINRTWKITNEKKHFILQRINGKVFKKPYELTENIRMVDDYLVQNHPAYLFVSPLQSLSGDEIIHTKEGFFRLFPFVEGSHTINVVSTPDQAFEAAFQFGKLTKLLSGFDTSRLHLTIPDFHNLNLRYHQFENSLLNGNKDRIKQCAELISEIKNHIHILYSYEKIKKSDQFKHHVTHHDTKISNVLFDERSKGICVIDLDTVMPGYFISDMGDMMRTYLSPANEEEKDFDKIEVRDDFFKAIVHGYLSNMRDELTAEEQGFIFYAGLFVTYMQAIRFLTDYFSNDLYYGASYPEQNFVRAGNQLNLLKKMEEKQLIFKKIILSELK